MFLKSKADAILVTTNASINRTGHLVMGRGAAREITARYPGIDLDFGRIVSDWHKVNGWAPYSVLWHPILKRPMIGIFQVKHQWFEDASIALIKESVRHLAHYATHPYVLGDHERPMCALTYAVNYPGIGNGRLNTAEVLPLIETLPANVQVWTLR